MKPETLNWLLVHSIASYEAEDKSTDKIRERISFILSLAITPCFAIAAYLVSSLRGELFATWNLVFFWVPLSISFLFLLTSTGYIAYVLLGGFEYSRVPLPSQIIQYAKSHPEQDLALTDTQLGLLHEIANSTDHNFKLNEHRKLKLLIAQGFAIGAFLLLVFFLHSTVGLQLHS